MCCLCGGGLSGGRGACCVLSDGGVGVCMYVYVYVGDDACSVELGWGLDSGWMDG